MTISVSKDCFDDQMWKYVKVLRMMIDTYQVFKVSYEKFILTKSIHTKFSFKYGKHGHQCLHRKKADYKYDHK